MEILDDFDVDVLAKAASSEKTAKQLVELFVDLGIRDVWAGHIPVPFNNKKDYTSNRIKSIRNSETKVDKFINKIVSKNTIDKVNEVLEHIGKDKILIEEEEKEDETNLDFLQ
jgi:hypothetical protein